MIKHESIPGAAFWHEAFAMHGTATWRVLPRVLAFGVMAAVVALLHPAFPWLAIRTDLIEAAGLVLGVLLVFRTAAGYERWWEARRLWGEIVNQSRNLIVAALSYGPADRRWQEDVVHWVEAFAHVTRRTLRDERMLPEVSMLLGDGEAARIAAARHMPSYVARRIAMLFRSARDSEGLDDFAFLELERERAALLDDVGGCERILTTPIPNVYSVTIRRFVVIYLCVVPFALAPVGLMSPAYVVFLAYPILTLEQIGAELQNPFVKRSLSHLSLGQLCEQISRNAEAALAEYREDETRISAAHGTALAPRPGIHVDERVAGGPA